MLTRLLFVACQFFLPFILASQMRPWQVGATLSPLPSGVVILSPLPGQALQGKVAVMGNTDVTGFANARLSFAYADNPTGTWFLIDYREQAVAFGILAEWDTTTITDGVYTLRLEVTFQDGRQESVVLAGLRVRNYTPVETETPVPSATPGAALAGAVPPTPLAPGITPTPLPPNPLQLSRQQVLKGAGAGALAAIGLLLLGALYVKLRAPRERR